MSPGSGSPTIRRASSADAAALVTLQSTVYKEDRWFVGDGPPSQVALERRLRALEADMSLYLVAVAGGDLAAWLELHRLLPSKLVHVAVLTLAVGQLWRREGLAGRLLAAAYPWALRSGVHKISLNVRANNAPAIALYEREGFRVEGREKDQVKLEQGFEDNLIMAKFL